VDRALNHISSHFLIPLSDSSLIYNGDNNYCRQCERDLRSQSYVRERCYGNRFLFIIINVGFDSATVRLLVRMTSYSKSVQVQVQV